MMPINSLKLKKIPQAVIELLSRLTAGGYEAYIVGGCLRDMIMGIPPHDFDVCTSASPDEIISIFNGDYTVLEVGKRFGTVIVLIGKEQYEITTYRIDGEYINNRRPENVKFTLDIYKDLARRDFTVNAMAYNPLTGDFKDPFLGLKDIENREIKCVGVPKDRFSEDGLRLMRALRFSAQLGFEIEPNTAQALRQQRFLLQNISHERIQSELCKIIMSKRCGADVLSEYRDVFAVVMPEIKPMFGFCQHNPHHCYDVWEHTLKALSEPVEGFDPDLITRLAILFHDIGKPHTFSIDADGIGHFYSHALVSAEICRRVLIRLKFSNEIIESVVWLVKKHDMPLLEDKAFIKRQLNKAGSVQFTRLIEIHAHDTAGQAVHLYNERIKNVRTVLSLLEKVIKDGECFALKDLMINGRDVMLLGVPAGREVGRLLDLALAKVVAGELVNSKDDLIGFIRSEIE